MHDAIWGAVAGALVACVAVSEYLIKPRRWHRDYGTEWKRHDAAAFHPTRTLISGNEKHYFLVRVAEEWQSDAGRLAIAMRHGQWSGVVVHQVSANGAFSKKGPYFIKNQPRKWARTGRQHLVEVEVGPHEFETSNPSGGKTRERGVRVLEFNTSRHAPLTLRQYGELRDREKAGRARPA
jgi:hypothetical protein